MTKSILIHNPKCSKCIGAKEILEAEGVDFITINYIHDGLKEKLLKHLPALTGLSFKEMVRTKEELYKELKLDEKKLSDEEWIVVLMKHPILLERPIFIHNDKAIIARPAELVKKLL
jgi:arsenate reductase